MGEPREEDESLVGTTVDGKYRVDRLLGRGGMGAVFEATHTTIGKHVALKFLDRAAARDPDSVMRFQREAEAASAVESAHIVHIFDSGTSADGRPFLVMELLTGEDLRAVLKREGRLPLAEAVHVVGQVLRALARAHAAGIVHRDLKPDNIFLCRRDDDPMFVKIVDFGISKITRRENTADTLTRRGMVLGTAFYMSPEQAQAFRDIDGRTDLYSVAAILFEALAGHPPHFGDVYEAVLIEICTKDAPDIRTVVPDTPAEIADVLQKGLQRDRDRRFESAVDFYDALAMAAPGLLRTGGVGPPRSRPSKPEDTANIGAATPPDATGRIVTAEGTAVRPSAPRDTRTQARRTIVAAVIAALGAFALTVGLMARRSSGDPSTQPDSSAESRTHPALGATPSASAEEPDAATDAVPSATGRPIHPKGPSTKPPVTASPPTSGKPVVKPPPTGVATGLQLDTKPP